MNKSKIEKLERIEIFRQKMQKLLSKKGFAEEAASGAGVLSHVTKLLKSERTGKKGEDAGGISLSTEDYNTLEIYDKQLESLLSDECILCGGLFIETVDMPFDSPDEFLWAL